MHNRAFKGVGCQCFSSFQKLSLVLNNCNQSTKQTQKIKIAKWRPAQHLLGQIKESFKLSLGQPSLIIWLFEWGTWLSGNTKQNINSYHYVHCLQIGRRDV